MSHMTAFSSVVLKFFPEMIVSFPDAAALRMRANIGPILAKGIMVFVMGTSLRRDTVAERMIEEVASCANPAAENASMHISANVNDNVPNIVGARVFM